jgi:branched-chain amino acid transport system permease protein
VGGGAVVVALAVAAPWWWQSELDVGINPFLIALIGAVGLNLLMGTAGQISLGQAAFLAVGGYAAVWVAVDLGLPFLAAVAVATATGAAIGLLVGLSAARVKGLYAVLGTLALHFVVIFAISRYQYYGNATAAFFLPEASVAGWEIDDGRAWYAVLLVSVLLSLWAYRRLLRTHFGRAWVAIRDREASAAVFGISLVRYRLLAWALSSGLIAYSGALRAYYYGTVSNESFTIWMAVIALAAVVVGGLGSPLGTVLGTAVLVLVPFEARSILRAIDPSLPARPEITHLEYVFDGVVLIAFMWLAPGGIASLFGDVNPLSRMRQRRKRVVTEEPDQAGAPAPVPSPPPATAERLPLLVARGLAAGYGSAGLVVDDVSVELDEGEVVAILGPNGAGKTALVRALAGYTRAEGGTLYRGTITMSGRELAAMPAYRRARAGLVMVPGTEKVFAELTVEENLLVPGRRRPRIGDVLESFPQLADKLSRPAVLLSGGERQLLAMARALLLEPKVLLIDETTTGLSPRVSREVLEHMRGLAEQHSLGVFLVEQNVRLAFDVADRYYLLNRGRLVSEGVCAEADVDEVVATYMGWEPVRA